MKQENISDIVKCDKLLGLVMKITDIRKVWFLI